MIAATVFRLRTIFIAVIEYTPTPVYRVCCRHCSDPWFRGGGGGNVVFIIAISTSNIYPFSWCASIVNLPPRVTLLCPPWHHTWFGRRRSSTGVDDNDTHYCSQNLSPLPSSYSSFCQITPSPILFASFIPLSFPEYGASPPPWYDLMRMEWVS